MSDSSTRQIQRAFLCLLVWLLFTSWLTSRIYLSIFQAGIFLLASCWLLQIFRRNIPLSVNWVVLVSLALPCFGAAQLISGAAVYPWRTAVSTLDFAALAATAWLCWQLSADPAFRQMFRRMVILLGLIASVVSVLHWNTSIGLILWMWPNPYQAQATFPLLNHSHLAAFVEMAIAPAAWQALSGSRLNSFYAWAAAIMTCALWSVGSRSGLVIATLELAATVLLTVRQVPVALPRRRRALAIGAAALVLIAGVGWQGVAARMSGPSQVDLRPVFTRASLQMVRERPWFGFGLGSWDSVYPAFASTDVGVYVEHAHNDWLEWAAEGGIPFACVFVALAVFSLVRALRQPWCLGALAVFIQCAIEFPLHKPAVAAFQFGLLGCIAASRVTLIRSEASAEL